MELIDQFKERVQFLKEWKAALKEQTDFESRDKCYRLQTEIDAKEQYIKTWKEQEANKAKENEALDKFLSASMGKVIKQLRGLKIDDAFQGKHREGILKRFKTNNYESVRQKKADFDSATNLIKKYDTDSQPVANG